MTTAIQNEEFYRTSPDWCRDTAFTGMLPPGQVCYREVPDRSSEIFPSGGQFCFDVNGECHASPDIISPVASRDANGYCVLSPEGSVGHFLVDMMPRWLIIGGLIWLVSKEFAA